MGLLLTFYGLQNIAEEEIELLISSIKHVIPLEAYGDLDFDKLANLVLEVAHLSHKDWEKTIEYSQRLEDLLLPHSIATEGSKIDDAEKSHLFRSIFERVLRDGKWEDARQASRLRNEEKKDERPWVVVVTGLNGIRKTTTIYLECYKVLLSEALVVPEGESDSIDPSYLPIGANSFFRQLDHMIAVLANLQFVTLYKIQQGDTDESRKTAIAAYSKYKDAIFARYRMLSEMVGIILCREAQRSNVNIMVETSGRDISMYKYVNSVFGDKTNRYRKLALHFTINDLSFAEQSVDIRMLDEIRRGKEALAGDEDENINSTVRRVVDVNSGGPYGSEVLKGVQADSERVWNEVWSDAPNKDDATATQTVTDGWYKACFHIDGDQSKPWKVTSILPDGRNGSVFEFPVRKHA